MSEFMARIRPDGQGQYLIEHLKQTARLAEILAAKIGLGAAGYLVGRLHDLGKYSDAFADHLMKSSAGTDGPEEPDGRVSKGRVDHSSAGAQVVWAKVGHRRSPAPFCGQFLAQVIASHHSGLIDSFAPDGTPVFCQRINKEESRTHRRQAQQRFLADYDGVLNHDLTAALQSIDKWRQGLAGLPAGSRAFQLGLGMRFLLSCLVAADWRSAACEPGAEAPQEPPPPDWKLLAGRLEAHLDSFKADSPVNRLRAEISQACRARAASRPGLYSLTVPTGGGKTLASLRFALHHAAHHHDDRHRLDRIIYIMPYTTIIEQNAQVVREILEPAGAFSSVLLEHHSNLEADTPHWQAKMRADSWDVPLIFTTMVQFLETLFSAGTSRTRRLHYLARSVLIFDEIQNLPTHSIHLFGQAVKFLVERAGCTALMCTATQPPPVQPSTDDYAPPNFQPDSEIGPAPAEYFKKLKRNRFFNLTEKARNAGEIADLARELAGRHGSCLVVANTVGWAEKIFEAAHLQGGPENFYLSTRLCPAHRKKVFNELKRALKLKKPLICVSTQLMECGVDLSFGAVIRLVAGLDRVLQAAGRGNRHGESPTPGPVYLVLAKDEKLPPALGEIKAGQEEFLRLLREEEKKDPCRSELDLNRPELVKRYFEYYYPRLCREMGYRVTAGEAGRDDTLLNMLGLNDKISCQPQHLGQSFASAARLYRVIGADSQGLIVPYGPKGKDLAADLSSAVEPQLQKKILREAQTYSVNLYHSALKDLDRAGALYSPADSGILLVNEQFYDEERLGLRLAPEAPDRVHIY
jgi:CRISPR-associated endonuclease/helicase Cas3